MLHVQEWQNRDGKKGVTFVSLCVLSPGPPVNTFSISDTALLSVSRLYDVYV